MKGRSAIMQIPKGWKRVRRGKVEKGDRIKFSSKNVYPAMGLTGEKILSLSTLTEVYRAPKPTGEQK
jgi:hypothetical protein